MVFRHAEIVGNVQMGRAGLGFVSGKPMWNKADPKDKRKMTVEQMHRQEEIIRDAKIVAQAMQKQWLCHVCEGF